MSHSTPSTAATPRAAGLIQPILAGVLAAIVGYASTFTLVLAALQAMGASPQQAGSGLFVLCVVIGLLNIGISWRLRKPLSIAWSTPGVALLLSIGMPLGSFGVTTGAFLMAAGLIVLAGLWGPFGRAVSAIPSSIANAMLAGILLTLCLAPIRAVEQIPLLALPVIAVWVLGLRFARRYAVPLAVLAAFVALGLTTDLGTTQFAPAWPSPVLVWPEFTLDGFIRIALPLFIVTMASQNLPGLAVMQANKYEVAPGPLFVATGLGSAATALLGGHSVNLAAITAAICAGPEAHPDRAQRWVAPVSAGFFYLALALLASTAAAFIAAAPPLLIEAVAGLALLSSLAGSLAGALEHEARRLPAIVTFVTAASGLSAFGLGAAFWGLVAGLVMHFALLQRSTRT